MDKFGSLFESPFTPGDGEAQTAEDRTDYDGMRMDYNGPDIAMPPQGPVVPPAFGGGQIDDMRFKDINEFQPQPAVMPPNFGGGQIDDMRYKGIPGGSFLKDLFGFGGGQTMPMPQPTPMPFRQPNFRPDTRAPGGGGMDYNGNPIGGGMGAQFNFAGPRTGMAQPMPMPQRRMPTPMRPAAGPVRPATSIKRPRIR